MQKKWLFALVALCLPVAALCQREVARPALATSYAGGVRTIADLPYRTVDGAALTLDLYIPPKLDGKKPAVLFVHGGGFIQGHSRMMGAEKDFPARLAALAAKGYVVASMAYRLAPKSRFPAQVRDAKAAVAWLRIHSEEYGIDPQRIAIWGSSAGGMIAASVGTSCAVPDLEPEGGNNGDNCVQAVADWFGPTTVDSDRLSAIYLGCLASLNCDADRMKAASPISRISPGDPPVQILHGNSDEIVPLAQSKAFEEALHAAGVEVEFRVVEGAGHGLRADDPGRQKAILDDAFASLTGFLDRTIGSSSLHGGAPATAAGGKAGD
jgi:acetyl esterase/lipase